MVSIVIISRELNPVILIPSSTFKARILSVTRAMDKPKERTILSITLTRLKKISVQAKPGRKKTSINPRIALMKGKRSRKGRINSNICFTGDNQSIAYIIPFNSYTHFTL